MTAASPGVIAMKNTDLDHPGNAMTNRPYTSADGTEGNMPEDNTPESEIPKGRLPLHSLLSGYIHEKRRAVAVLLAGMLLFFTVCLLYHLENLADLLYAFFLWAFITLCFAIFDFVRYIRRYEAFRAAIENTENLAELLPPPSGLMDRQYHSIIEKLTDDLRQLRSEMSLKDADMNDYYSMWAHQVKVPISAMRLLLQNVGEGGGTLCDVSVRGTGGAYGRKNGEAGSKETSRTHSRETGGADILEPSGSSIRETGGNTSLNNHVIKLLSEELFKIEQYVDMVLYYQRLESISSDFLFKKYDLNGIVKQALKKYALLFINSRLSLDLQEFSCVVVTDEKWLQFALGQVISNALKYTHRGGISIYLEKTPADAFLVIEDTGIGIRPEDLPRIFERGYTGYNGRLDKKSTGIGLYLCRKILDKLSHTIEVTSEVGKGTKVTVGFALESVDDT